MRKWLIVLCSLTLALACNFPGFPRLSPALPPTETVTLEDLPGETEEDARAIADVVEHWSRERRVLGHDQR